VFFTFFNYSFYVNFFFKEKLGLKILVNASQGRGMNSTTEIKNTKELLHPPGIELASL